MRTLLILPLTVLAVAGCGGGSGAGASSTATTAAPARAAATGPRHVTIAGYKFAPASVTVARGTRVTWTNRDAAPHTATATGLDTGTLRKGQSRTLTLSKPGTYAYVCQFHPYMHGTVVVR